MKKFLQKGYSKRLFVYNKSIAEKTIQQGESYTSKGGLSFVSSIFGNVHDSMPQETKALIKDKKLK